jgi:hypothetical protein
MDTYRLGQWIPNIDVEETNIERHERVNQTLIMLEERIQVLEGLIKLLTAGEECKSCGI